MLEFEKKHKRGRKTFVFLFFQKVWWLALIGIGFMYLAWAIYAGPFRAFTADFLARRPDWYVSPEMLAQWFLLLGISIVFVAWLIINVQYRHYKFILDRHAVHLHHGIFFTREITIPYAQITNVHIDRPLTYKMYGVARLDIVTAADRDTDSMGKKTKTFLMPVIDLSIARQLATQLLECAARSRKGQHVYDEYEDEYEEDDEDDTEETDKNMEVYSVEEFEEKTDKPAPAPKPIPHSKPSKDDDDDDLSHELDEGLKKIPIQK